MLVDGSERRFASPSDARDAGIETVFQNLALIPTLNIAENIFLKRERCGPGAARAVRASPMQKGVMRREVQSAFERFGVTLPPLRTQGQLALGRPAPGRGDHPRGACGAATS